MADTSRTIKLKLDADARGLITASKLGEAEVDRFTKSVDKKFKTSGDDTSKSFVSRFAGGIKKGLSWFTGSGAGGLQGIGQQAAAGFGNGFFAGLGGLLKTPVVGPIISGGLLAVVTTILPAVGAVAASTLVLAFGAGLAALGVVFAAKSQAVKDVWKKTLGDMGDEMKLLSRPFEDTLIHLASTASSTFATFKPELEKAFQTLAPALSAFGDDLGKAFGKLASAIGPLSSAAGDVLRAFGPALQSAFASVSAGLVTLSDSVKKNPTGLADFTKGIGDVVKELLVFIAALNDADGQFKTLTGGTSAVTAVMVGLQAVLEPLVLVAQGLNGELSLLNKLTAPVGTGFHYTATTAQEATTATGYWTQGLSQAQLAAMGVTGATKGTTTAAETLTQVQNRQTAATNALIQSMFKLQNLQLGLLGAEINYKQAVADATKAVQTNGKNLDLNTQKGRDNQTQLDNLASATNAQTQQMIQSNKGLAAATKFAEGARAGLSKLAQQMGMNKTDADRFAASVIAIPSKKDVKVTVSGATAAKKNVDGLAASVAALKNRTVYVNMLQTSNVGGIPSSIKAPHRAAGGPVAAGRTYLVGEHGPEMLTMGSQSGQITNADQTSKALAGGDVHVYVTIDGQQLQGRIDKTIRTNNRDLRRTVKAA